MPDLAIIGLNHTSASLAQRERFALSEKDQQALLNELAQLAEEAVILCTCNRTELIYNPQGKGINEKLFQRFCAIGELSDIEAREVVYRHEDEHALRHLFRVAASLDSLVPGETQITGQLKQAFDTAFELGTAKANFNRIYQRMLQAAKVVRNGTNLGEGAISVSSVAVQLAQTIFDDLASKRVLLVGAGEMCGLAGQHFQSAGVSSITVANRTLERARILAAKFTGESRQLDDLPELLAGHDIVFSCTAAENCVITLDDIKKTMRKRRGQPLFLIDVAVPRDIDPAIQSLSDVYLYNIDSLQVLVNRNIDRRRREAEDAEVIVKDEVRRFIQDYNESIGPVIKSLQQREACCVPHSTYGARPACQPQPLRAILCAHCSGAMMQL